MSENILYVSQLQLQYFRNYSSLELDNIPDGKIVLTGPNGSGKTNLMEAVSLLAPGRGLRGVKLAELQQFNADNKHLLQSIWSIFARVNNPLSGDITIGTGGDQNNEKRIVKINEEKQRGQNSLSEYVSVLYLTPQIDQTFADGSTSRRQYLDRITAIFIPDHTKQLFRYDQLKSQRKKILTEYSNPDATWLNSIEAKMAEPAIAIAADRMEAISHLQDVIYNNEDNDFPKASLSIKGELESWLDEMPALEAENKLKKRFLETRTEDAKQGRTTAGPHKSDFEVIHKGTDLPTQLCSTGQQKSMLLSLTLAIAKTRLKWQGSCPIILLDEVVAHLDEKHRELLFNELNKLPAQIWMTGTDQGTFASLKPDLSLHVKDGKIER